MKAVSRPARRNALHCRRTALPFWERGPGARRSRAPGAAATRYGTAVSARVRCRNRLPLRPPGPATVMRRVAGRVQRRRGLGPATGADVGWWLTCGRLHGPQAHRDHRAPPAARTAGWYRRMPRSRSDIPSRCAADCWGRSLAADHAGGRESCRTARRPGIRTTSSRSAARTATVPSDRAGTWLSIFIADTAADGRPQRPQHDGRYVRAPRIPWAAATPQHHGPSHRARREPAAWPGGHPPAHAPVPAVANKGQHRTRPGQKHLLVYVKPGLTPVIPLPRGRRGRGERPVSCLAASAGGLRALSTPSAGQVIVLRGDARQLPLPDQSVDLIVDLAALLGLRSWTDGGARYPGRSGGEDTPQQWLGALMLHREVEAVRQAVGDHLRQPRRQVRSGTQRAARQTPAPSRTGPARAGPGRAARFRGAAQDPAGPAVAVCPGLHRRARADPARRHHLDGPTRCPSP